MIKVSIVVPVYNVEEYLRECLDSIISQTLKEIEIICIDDCSTDNSYSILEEYANIDNRIRIFRTSGNIGSGATRNIGIREALGEYVGFVDSDDCISKDYFEHLYNTALKYDSDITSTLNIIHYKEYLDKDNVYIINNYISKEEKEKNCINNIEGESFVNIKNDHLYSREFLYVTIYNKIHRKEFLISNNIFFMDIKDSADDVYFYIKELLSNPKTSYNHRSIYYYRIRNGSQMDVATSSLDSFKNTIDLYNSIETPDDISLIPYIHRICFRSLFFRFNRFNNKELLYKYLYDFVKNIKLLENFENEYKDYICIYSSTNYPDYLYKVFITNSIKKHNNEINNIKSSCKNLSDNLNKYSNKIFSSKLFAIKNYSNYFVLIFLGLKFTYKKR